MVETIQMIKKVDLPEVNQAKVDSFISKWSNTGGSGAELSDFQSFIIDLCDVLDLPRPNPKSDSTSDFSYIFERPVAKYSHDGEAESGKNRIDLYRRNCFVMEGKQSGKTIGTTPWSNAMQKAKNQADKYVRSLPVEDGRPPFIVVVDVGNSIQLFSEFSCSGGIYIPFPDPGSFIIKLKDIADEEVQRRLQCLWLKPELLDPSKYAAEVTKEVSIKLANLAKSLEESGYQVERIAHFLKRCLFTMFSEDVELIPESSFTNLLVELVDTPEYFADSMKSLWDTMNSGGFEGQLRKVLPRFNGGLFSEIDPIPLNKEQIEMLVDAGKADWRYVEPAIFGTLLERALDPRERHKLGAHYTPRSYVERLVLPTVIEPLRDEWEATKVSVEMFLQQEKTKKAIEILRAFHFRLCEIKILDPACGSANFLYVTLEHLKRLEGEVLNALKDLTSGQSMLDTEGLMIDPHQFLGIEINPRAAAIAEIVLWIGFLQWHYRINGRLELPEPILKDFKNIENRDALIDYDSKENLLDELGQQVTTWDGHSYKLSPTTGERIPDEGKRLPAFQYINPRKAKWPKADFIVGNPPYLGARRIRLALGDGYLNAIRSVYDKVPENADYVMYWWHRSGEKVGSKEATSFGLITTNSLRQSFCRRVVEDSFEQYPELAINFVIPDHPWVDSADGASVRVSLVSAGTYSKEGVVSEVIEEIEDGAEFQIKTRRSIGVVSPNLSVGVDPAGANELGSNAGVSCVGYQLTGKGFILEGEQLASFDSEFAKSHIRPLLSGSDITRKSRGFSVFDLYGLSEEEVQVGDPKVYQWVLERVKPEREQNNRKSLRDKWWVYGEARSTFRPALEGIQNLYVTSLTAKHRVFVEVPSNTVSDSTTVMFAFNNAFHWGVASSRIHICWALAAGGRLGVGNDPRYNKSKCFETFPFPDPNQGLKDEISTLINKISLHREQQQSSHPNLTITAIYNVVEKIRRGEELSVNEQQVNNQALCSVLLSLHDDLDKAVLNAYGWGDLVDRLVGLPGATCSYVEKPNEQVIVETELLSRLLDLNAERALEEANGNYCWLRPDMQESSESQKDMDLGKVSKSIVDKKSSKQKLVWPKEVREQIGILQSNFHKPLTIEEMACRFKRNPVKQVTFLLEALEALGKAEKNNDVWSLT